MGTLPHSDSVAALMAKLDEDGDKEVSLEEWSGEFVGTIESYA
jgi:hypothetical protein